MRASRLAYGFLFSFLGMLFCLQAEQTSSYPVPLLLSIGVLVILLLLTPFRPIRNVSILGIAATLGVVAAILAVVRTTHVNNESTIDTYANGIFSTIEGVITEEPDRRPMQVKYTISADQLTQSGTTLYPIHGRVLATDRRMWPKYQYGDRVRVRGTLERPEAIETFSYDRYLSRYDIYAVMYSGSFSLVGGDNVGNPLFRILSAIKDRFERQINRLYAEPQASFMAGLLTGSRKGIPDHLLQAFNITGLTHIIAISGYNITIVISVITGMLFWLPLKWRFVPAVSAIVLFTLFVGASAAVVRAAVMGVLGLIALQTNRQTYVRLTVLWAATFMLMWNPKYLWYDAGFQLSFLAVIGLTELSPLLDRLFAWVPPHLGIREGLQMTCAAQLAAVPLIVMLFQRLSLIAPIANVLVAPFVPLAMLFGFVGTVVSFLYFPLGQVIAYAGWGALQWILTVTTLLSKLPLASVSTPNISSAILLTYYAALILLILWHRKRYHHLYT